MGNSIDRNVDKSLAIEKLRNCHANERRITSISVGFHARKTDWEFPAEFSLCKNREILGLLHARKTGFAMYSTSYHVFEC